ncbi:MAG TPA: hypothetical protein VN947_31100 [Polyangia bacterium]|nr:hypothetical protein [Polyangia bacterium]
MAVAQEKQDVDSNDNDNLQKQDAATEQKADAADADSGNEQAEAEEESEKEQVSPSLTVTNPGSGAQYPGGEPFTVDFDCEGDTDFTAHVSVVDASGKQVLGKQHEVELDEGKGHGEFTLGGDKMAAGKYDVLVWGAANGQTTAVQKIQVEVVDAEAEEEPAPALAVEGDDPNDSNAAVT